MAHPTHRVAAIGAATVRERLACPIRSSTREIATCEEFYGILIRMFFNDHPPPHFHARYGEFEATVEIGTLEVLDGQLPRRALNLPGNGR